MSLTAVLAAAGGLAALVVGAELLVRGASHLSERLGIAPLVIGLTVVAYGTSTPELAVSIRAGLAGRPGLALGNALGSSIFNILLILGLASVLAPLAVSRHLVRVDVPIMIGVTALTYLLALDGRLGRPDGLLLLGTGLAYTVGQILSGRRGGRGPEPDEARSPPAPRSWPLDAAQVLLGLGMLAMGAGWLVDGAAALARWMGVGETLIGLTVVAAGTSLPEVATTVVAGLRGARDLATGNVIGSNVFNLLVVLGAAAALSPGGLSVPEHALHFDFPVALAVAFACLPIFFTGHRIARWEGGLFLAYYVAYVLYLFLSSGSHASLPAFRRAMLVYVVPLTAITLATVTLRSWRGDRGRS